MARRSGFTLDAPGGDAVLLLHGLTGAPAEMHPLARHLRRQGFAVHAPLLAGHGGDRSAMLANGWRDWLQSAQQAFDSLRRDYARVHVGGICLGALLAVAVAASRPTGSIAAIGTTYRYDGWSMPRIAALRSLVKLGAGLPFVRALGFAERTPYGLKDEKIRSFVVNAQRTTNGGAVDSFPLGAVRQLYLLADHVDRIAPSVRAPAILLHAREDDTSSLANAEWLKSRLGGAVHLEIFEDSYHMIHLDRELEAAAAAIIGFFGATPEGLRRRA